MKVDLPMPLCLALSLAISLLSPQALLAQQNEGSLTGTASNGSGAGIPNAKVSVRNLNTRDITETQTDSAGRFTLIKLAPGDYELTVSARLASDHKSPR